MQSTSKMYPIACLNCRDKHYKCFKELPACSSCVKRGISCVYVPPKRNRRPRPEEVTSERALKQLRYSANSDDNAGTVIEEEPEQQVVQLICGKVSRPMTLYRRIEEYSEKIQHALLCSHYALVFQNCPCLQDLPEVRIDGYYRHMIPTDVGVSFSHLHSAISETAKRLPRHQLKNLSQYLFSLAKETLLKPDIYSSLPMDHRLTQLALRIAQHLIWSGSDEKRLEARMLLSAAELYVEYKGRGEMASKGTVEKVTNSPTEEIFVYLTRAQLALVFNKFRNVTTFSGIKELFTTGIELYKSKLNWQHCSEPDEVLVTLYNMKSMLFATEEEAETMNDLQKLYHFLQGSQQLIQQPVDIPMLAVHMGLIGGEILAIQAVSDQYKNDEAVTKVLGDLRRDSAKKLTSFCRQNFSCLQLFGAWNIWPYILACKSNCDYADDLMSSSEYTEEMSDHLGILQANIIYLDVLNQKYEVDECLELSKKLKKRVEDICWLQMQHIQVSSLQFPPGTQPSAEDLFPQEDTSREEWDVLSLFMIDYDQ